MSRNTRLVFASLGTLLALGSMAVRADVPIELTAQWGGPTRAVAVEADRAYIGVGHRLVVLDVSDPGNPAFLGQAEVLWGAITGVAVAGDYAYVTFWGELWVFDVSNPAAPEPVSSLFVGGAAQNVFVSGTRAYIADGEGDVSNPGGLKIVDITDPFSPSVMGGLDTAGNAWSVAVQGDYAYLADGTGGLVIADVTDPYNPSQVSVLAMSNAAMGVAVAGQYVYVAASYEGGLRVVDVSDAANPAEVGHCGTDGAPADVAVDGDYAYVPNGWNGVALVNISDPANPTKVGGVGLPGWTLRVALSGGNAWLATEARGLQIVDRSAAPTLSLLAEYRNRVSGNTSDVAIAANDLYVSDGLLGGGVEVLAVGDPANPQRIGGVGTYEYPWGLSQVVGNSLYLADGCAGSAMLDITDPANPQRAGSAGTGCASRDAWLDGDYAYVADDHQSLLVIDTSAPSNPYLVGSWQDPGAPGYALGVTKSGDYVYLANGPAGLEVIDVSAPASPSRVGHCSTNGWANDVVVGGDYAYVATSGGGLEIVDISTPASPTPVGACNAFGDGQGVVVKGQYAFVAAGGQGLQLVDVADPANPLRIGQTEVPGFCRRVAVAGLYAYVAAGDNGIVIAKIGGDYVWNNVAGGDFVVPEYWNPLGPPDPFGRAIFNLPDVYGVTMPTDGGVVHDRLLVNGGDVSIDLNNQTYTLQHEWDESPSVAIADDPANPVTARLTVFNGADPGVAAHELELGRWAGNKGTLLMNGARWDATDYFFTIGVVGYGTVTLNQSYATHRYGWLGFFPSGEGTLTLTASQWDLGFDQELVIGREGRGAMTLLDESASNMGRLTLAGMNGSNGDLSVQSLSTVTVEGPMIVAQDGGQAFVEVSDYGALAVNGRGAGDPEDSVGLVLVQNGGSAELDILNGGSVAVQYICTIGGWSPPPEATRSVSGFTCDASLYVDGDDALLEAPHSLEIGRDACGTATVSNHGVVNAGLAFIGLRARGYLTVTGAGSSFTASNITRVGGTDGIEGQVTVTEAAHLTSEHQVQVGYEGTGTTQVTQGGVLSSYKADSPTGTSGIIAWYGTGAGSVTVNGNGSQWIQDGGANVGWFGNGALNVLDSGLVESADGIVARMVGSTGGVVVSDPNSKWAISGSLSVGGLMDAIGGVGTVDVRDGGAVTVGTELRVWSGSSVSLDSGAMTVGGGPMPASTNTIAVYPGGTLSGTGQVTGHVAVSGGTVSPGTSAGTLQVDGIYSQDATGTLRIELGGTGVGESDRLSITGNASLGGTLALSLVPGYVPSMGDSFVILTCGARDGRFATVTGGSIGGGKSLMVLYDASSVTVKVATSPDFDGDGDVDLTDFGHFRGCFNGPNRPPAMTGCSDADLDADTDVDLSDFGAFQRCFNGPNRPPAC